eukprot:gene20669-22707_t
MQKITIGRTISHGRSHTIVDFIEICKLQVPFIARILGPCFFLGYEWYIVVLQQPLQESRFITAAFSPLKDFCASSKNSITSDVLDVIMERSISTALERWATGLILQTYYVIVHELVTSIKKTEESLQRLKRLRKGGDSNLLTISSNDISDESKIRKQLHIDINKFGEEKAHEQRRFRCVRTPFAVPVPVTDKEMLINGPEEKERYDQFVKTEVMAAVAEVIAQVESPRKKLPVIPIGYPSVIDRKFSYSLFSMTSRSHDGFLAASITHLTATVAALAADKKELRAAFTSPQGPATPQCQSRPPSSSGNFLSTGFRCRGRWPTPTRQERNASQRSQRCFHCHMLGHFAKDCLWNWTHHPGFRRQ